MSDLIIAITVCPDFVGQRLDKFLATHEDIGTRSRAAKLIHSGLVTLNGKTVKPSKLIEKDEVYNIAIPQESAVDIGANNIDLDIVYEDSDLLVVNKQAGLVVHPAPGHPDNTLVNALVHHCHDLSMGFGEHRPGIVHRIDKDTSGLLVVAKNDKTHEGLASQFKDKSAHRIYWAFVFSRPKESSGTIESRLHRNPKDRKKYCSDKTGSDSSAKLAITFYELQKQLPNGLSLIHCRLETGRTHQIRVHMSELGHPIVGDVIYGSNGRVNGLKSVKLRSEIRRMERIGLHAAELGFVHPSTNENLMFSCPWPTDLEFLANDL